MDPDKTAGCRGTKSSRLTAELLFAILAAGVLLAWWLVGRADREMRADLLEQAQLVAQAVNTERLQRSLGHAGGYQLASLSAA